MTALVEQLMSRMCAAQKEIETPSFILDAEIVAVDSESHDLKSFQDLSQRARKDVRLEDIKVSVGIFAYDLMYLNGRVGLEKIELYCTHFSSSYSLSFNSRSVNADHSSEIIFLLLFQRRSPLLAFIMLTVAIVKWVQMR